MGLFKRTKAEQPVVRFAVNLSQDKKVDVLFTPSIFGVAQKRGIVITSCEQTAYGVITTYADILFCAACNCWELSGNKMEDAPFTRLDFHTFHAENPQEFKRVAELALKAFAHVVASIEALTKREEEKTANK